MRLVLDASVMVKWLLRDPDREQDLAQAQDIMDNVGAGRVELIEPVHWLIEVAGVITRLSPQTAADDLILLHQLAPRVADDLGIQELACRLSIDLDHHLFDTLYHAVALETESFLVTADDRYLAKAREVGRISPLRDWSPHSP